MGKRDRSPDAAWRRLERDVTGCERCPRLVAHRRAVAEQKRAAYREQSYWGKPVPGFGDRRARLLIVGLAPGAHGANRTGRMFTGDRSGDWLYRALHETGFASQPESSGRGDGLQLRDAFISATARCAPPDNKPSTAELRSCRPFLQRELELLGSRLRVLVCLGGVAWTQTLRLLADEGWKLPRPRPPFAHGVEAAARSTAADDVMALASYHPSQQNTFTGKLTHPMLAAVFDRARQLLG